MRVIWITVLLFAIPVLLHAQDSIPQAPAVDLTKPLYQLKGHADDVEVLAYSPNGKYIATGDWRGNINIYKANSDSLVRTISGGKQAITCLAFSRDSRFLASGSLDNSASIWNADTGFLVKRFEGHTRPIKGICFDRTGSMLLTASLDTTVKLWNIKTSTKRNIKVGRPATAVAVSFDGSLMFIATESPVIATYNMAGVAQKTFSGHGDIVNALAVSNNGLYLVSGSNDKTAILWDIKTGKTVLKLTGHTWKVQTVAFSSDNKYILTGSNDASVKLWDAEKGGLIRSLTGYGNNFKTVAFSPDITMIATASAIKGGGAQGAYIWPSGFIKETPVKPGTGIKQKADSTKKIKPAPGIKKSATDSLEKIKPAPVGDKKPGPENSKLPADTIRKRPGAGPPVPRKQDN